MKSELNNLFYRSLENINVLYFPSFSLPISFYYSSILKNENKYIKINKDAYLYAFGTSDCGLQSDKIWQESNLDYIGLHLI